MKARLLFLLSLVVFTELPKTFAARSKQMLRELNAQVPDWLSLGVPIKAVPASELPDSNTTFRPLSGGSKSTRDRVTIPSRGIEIKVDYEISPYFGSSLSPDGEKLIINSGTDSRLYEILPNGEYQEKEIRLPHVTYDDGPKGFITQWSWAGNDVLLGNASITDETGDEILEKRIYVFQLNVGVLNRIDLSSLKLSSIADIEVAQVSDDLQFMKIIVGGKYFTVKAVLKSATSGEKHEATKPVSNILTRDQSIKGLLVVLLATIFAAWLLLRKRN